MPINNRDLGVSEQRKVLFVDINAATPTGASLLLSVIPYACQLQAVSVAALGVSGAPSYDFRVLRWTAAGSTIISLGISALIIGAAVGVSGPAQGWSGIRPGGSTLLQLNTGDVLAITSGVANTASEKLSIALVVQRTADLVSALGLST